MRKFLREKKKPPAPAAVAPSLRTFSAVCPRTFRSTSFHPWHPTACRGTPPLSSLAGMTPYFLLRLAISLLAALNFVVHGHVSRPLLVNFPPSPFPLTMCLLAVAVLALRDLLREEKFRQGCEQTGVLELGRNHLLLFMFRPCFMLNYFPLT